MLHIHRKTARWQYFLVQDFCIVMGWLSKPEKSQHDFPDVNCSVAGEH